MIKCADRADRLSFTLDEVIDPAYTPQRGDEVAFAVSEDALGCAGAPGEQGQVCVCVCVCCAVLCCVHVHSASVQTL